MAGLLHYENAVWQAGRLRSQSLTSIPLVAAAQRAVVSVFEKSRREWMYEKLEGLNLQTCRNL